MLGEVPRVRRDILQQIPGLDTYYDRRIAPEDNVSRAWLDILASGFVLTHFSPSKLSAVLPGASMLAL